MEANNIPSDQSMNLSLGKAIIMFNIPLFLYLLNEKPTNSLYRKKCGIFL